MRLVWLSEDDRLPAAAAELAVRELAVRVKVRLPEDAVVMVEHTAPLPGQLISIGHDAEGTTVYFVSSHALEDALVAATDAKLRAAGIDPADPAPARRFRRLLLRRLPHWSPEQVDELVALWPRIADLADETADDERA